MSSAKAKKKKKPAGDSLPSGEDERWAKIIAGRQETARYRYVDWVAVGIDVSFSSISVAGMARLQNGKVRRARALTVRWERSTDYYTRMIGAAKGHEILFDVFKRLKVMPELDQVHIAIEEAVSIGQLQRMGKLAGAGQVTKQQLQISGALMGGLLRWGWQNIYEIQAQQWQKIVADDLEISTHYSKWGNVEYLSLPTHFPPVAKKSVGKYRAWQWVEQFHPKWDGKWPDMIGHSKRGLIHRPEKSHAQGVQSDDRYEALGIMEWMRRELKS